MDVSLQARVVFPVDRPPIENGVVTIRGERIVSVGAKRDSTNVTDLGDVALLPGLINSHTHLEFSYLRRPLGRPGISLVDWIRLVIAERGRSDYAAALERGVRESLSSGVTTIGDISTRDQVFDFDITYFYEVIGFSRARAESARDALTARLEVASNSGHRNHGISPHAPYTVSQNLVKDLVRLAKEKY
jgi:cytosine/adenosine deaminase-related metal-dependent hydrolase